MILSTKKNHQQSKKNIPQQKICKIVGLSLYTLMQHQKSKSEFAKFKTKKYSKKFFACYITISSHHFQKRKKMYSRLLPPPLKNKKNIPPWKKKDSKKKLTYFHLCFFVFFFLSNHHTTKQKYFLVSCRNKNCSKLKQIPLFVFPSSLLFFGICFDRLLFLSYPPFLFLRKRKKVSPVFCNKRIFLELNQYFGSWFNFSLQNHCFLIAFF